MTTCQICGRAIKANTGLIAHHGYRRPQHWHQQTSSCQGARCVSYEVGHDALDRLIPVVSDRLAAARTALAAWTAEPPETITHIERDAWGAVRLTLALERPDGFAANVRSYGLRPRTYEAVWSQRLREHHLTVGGLTAQLEYLRDRLAAWKQQEAAA